MGGIASFDIVALVIQSEPSCVTYFARERGVFRKVVKGNYLYSPICCMYFGELSSIFA